MKEVEVRASRLRYKVLIGSGLLAETGNVVRRVLAGTHCAIVADENVAALFGATVLASLTTAGFTPQLITIAPGEKTKSFAQAGVLCQQLNAGGLDRSSFLVSLGGGVVGDLVGFVASIYLRGIPYVSVPTTLLAQSDSCVGGKTGVNSADGKNLIGSFHHPALVIADTDTLRTLPERIWNEGFAEAIKHGIVCDALLFESVSTVRRDDPAEFIGRNIALKGSIVAEDERDEKGLRALLNFGHTVGHAIEHAAGYGHFLHGEAISLGMVAAARVSIGRAGLSLGDCDRIIATLQSRQLPTKLPPEFPRDKILAALLRDKKFDNGRIRFVVASAIGRASLSAEVTMADLRAAIDALF